MKHSGFTLIELLVVVLIVGVLSAIALPQYQRAVERSRAAEALVALRNIKNAMEICRMENGTVCQQLSSLTIEMPGTPVNERTIQMKYFTLDIRNFGGGSVGYEIVATRNHDNINNLKYYIYYGYNDATYCVALDAAASYICSTLCATNPQHNGADGYSCTVS